MNEKLKKKIIKISLSIVTAISILFIVMMYLLAYNEEGETNIPFKVSKIIIVSSTDGRSEGTQWVININQNNDIYLYIDKNKSYQKTELIENVKIANFNITKETENGSIKIYKATTEDSKMFDNSQQFEISELIYEGELKSNIKQSKISNQGGLIAFRCANNNISQYSASHDTEVNYDELLKKTNVKEEDLKFSISFDLEIKVVNKKTYQATINLELPIEDIIEKGRTELEITDLEDITFKII